jgi:WhiB family redox-sensing transcriptional regulator
MKDERLTRERRAKAICAVCPVQVECLEYAIRTREPHGVWGGLSEMERRAMLRTMDRDLSLVEPLDDEDDPAG